MNRKMGSQATTHLYLYVSAARRGETCTPVSPLLGSYQPRAGTTSGMRCPAPRQLQDERLTSNWPRWLSCHCRISSVHCAYCITAGEAICDASVAGLEHAFHVQHHQRLLQCAACSSYYAFYPDWPFVCRPRVSEDVKQAIDIGISTSRVWAGTPLPRLVRLLTRLLQEQSTQG